MDPGHNDTEPRPPLWRRPLGLGLIALLAVSLAASIPVSLLVGGWWRQAKRLADLHRDYRVAHPGWSFPARIVSSAVPLDAPKARLIAEARARAYRRRCPQPEAGEYCDLNGRVVPRQGDRLEPVVLGWLVGPHGEIREHLPIGHAPRHLIDAILIAEDRDFYEHHGVNSSAMLRAALANAREGSYSQGASTLTMQVVRSLVGQKEKTLRRKLREAVMALALDRHLGKKGVLQMYLDAPYLGQRGGLSICGFQAAARHYFGKDARDLDIGEAATLAATLPAPARFAPDRFPERARERRDRLLRALAKQLDYDVEEALASPVKTVRPQELVERHPAYLSALRAWLEDQLPAEVLYGSGLVITAAIDLPMQETTERLFAEKTRLLESLIGRRKDPLQSAAVLMETDSGLIRAIWGGSDVTSTSFNRATQAYRQPGSSFKPLVYALAFGQPAAPDGTPRFTASSLEPNSLRVFHTPQGDWSPRNVGGEYTPTASLAFGLAWSQNIATASLLEEIGGPKPLIEFASRLGFDSSRFPPEYGLALGQAEVTVLQMTQFVATVANGGRLALGVPALSAVDPAGRERLERVEVGPQVIAPKAALLTRELMRLVVDAGTGGSARGAGDDPGYEGPALGKTGTTDSERDVWFIGATPRYAAAVWLGYDTPQGLGASASDLAAPLWGWWIRRVTDDGQPPPAFPDDDQLVHKWICTTTGKLAGPSCRTLYAPYLRGTEPKARCTEEHALPEEAVGPDGTVRVRYESMWKRLAREKAEREQIEPPGRVEPPGAIEPPPAPGRRGP